MKIFLIIFAVVVFFSPMRTVWGQESGNEEEEYQKKLEAWKKEKEEIERRNQEKLNSMGAQKAAKAHFNEGAEYFKRGNYSSAAKEFEESVKLNPNYQKAYRNLGLVYKKLGDYKKAEINFDKAIAIVDGDQEVVQTATRDKINLYIEIKDYTKALQTIDGVLKKVPNDEETCFLKGKIVKDGLNQYKEAEKIFHEIIGKNASHVWSYYELANLHNLTEDFPSAVSDGLKGLANSNDAEATAALHFELAEAYRKLGQAQDAVTHYQKSKTSRKYRESAEYWLKTLSLN